MKNNFPKLLCFLLIVCSSVPVCEAQYATGVGVHVGKFSTGIDIKHFFDATKTMGYEIFGGFTQEANSGYMGKLFFVKQLPIRQSRLQVPTKIIFGVGSHAGFYKDPYYRIKDGQALYYPVNTFSVGIDGMFGLEYNTRRMPVTIGVDATPYYSLLNPGPSWIDFGVNVRYVIR
ncbi:MAG: hypothetical protein NT126_04820 [Bacteroidetes bacterium]|nr:hypothetical protein [Bacteroidota bacterium]